MSGSTSIFPTIRQASARVERVFSRKAIPLAEYPNLYPEP